MLHVRLLPGFSVALLLVAATVVTAHSQQPAARDTLNVIPIAPVSVTVLRTPFRMEDIPYAVSVNTQEEIQRGKPGISVEEALRIIPGLQVENRYNYALGERLTIRGFGARSQFGVRGVRVFVDGIPATFPDGQSSLTHVDVKNLGRVEVIRGPAASLYGNTAGGVVQMEMQRPPAAAVAQEFGLIAGHNDLLRLQSTTGGQFGAATYQFNVSRLEYGGFRPNSQATNLYLNGRFGYDTERDRVRFTFYGGDSDAMSPGALSLQQQEEDRFQTLQLNLDRRTGKTVQEGMVGASWMRDGNVGGTELSAYLGKRDVVNPIIPTIIGLDRVGGGVRGLFRSTPIGALGIQLAMGAEADYQKDDRQNFANVQGERGALTLDQLERVQNAGLFSQLTLRPADRVTVLGGLRYDWFDFSADDRFITATSPDFSGSRQMDALSPSVGLTYVVNEQVHLYGNVGTTFETPTTTELANRPEGTGGFNPDLDPQRATSYEVGARAQLHQMMALEMAVYRAAVRNSLVPFTIQGRTFFRNAARATHQGVEFGGTFAPVAGVALRTAYTYTGARFDEYVDRFDVSHAGNQIPGVAPHRIESSLSISPPTRTPFAWYAAVENRYVSRSAVNDANTAFSPSYNLIDLRGGLEGLRLGSVRFDPFGGISNVRDTRYNAAVTVNDANQRFFETGPGRAIYVGGNARFERR
jgi:iron complex outermembrane recepter protein